MAATKKTSGTEVTEAKKKRRGVEKPDELKQENMIQKYLSVFERCMQEDPKTFDAKGALNALDQISKILGLDTPIKTADIEGNKVILTLSDKVGERGD